MTGRVFSRIARKSYEAFYSLDNCRHCDLKKDTDKTARKTSFSMVRNQNESRNHEFTELVCKCRWTTIQGLCKINSISATTLIQIKIYQRFFYLKRERDLEKTNEQTIVRAVQVGTRHSKQEKGEHGF